MTSFAEPTHLDPPSLGWDYAAEQHRYDAADDRNAAEAADFTGADAACETKGAGVDAGSSLLLAAASAPEAFTRDVLYTQAELDALDFARRADLPAHVRILLESLWLALSLRARNGRA